jgi:MinD-like ATPase involved in chromosome partitioning or flagellar assembly
MGKIIAIHSFRGGTGKSNVTANLAAQVALADKRVGVVDTDIQSPGIHVLFGLDGSNMGNTLNDFLDCLLIDTHPGLNEETLLSIAISDLLIVILRPDHQDFQGTAVTVDIARSLDVPNLLLMINKAVPGYDYEDLKSQIESVYEAPLTGILPLNFEVAGNASKDLFSLNNPHHPWSLELSKITEAILSVP